mmetsp:Transcript_24987/g.77151  ORF Transcript_24987/g.77151 Transcript_24987/m.77151 type:complete len:259 (+) Transcript_24987:3237-4013(+)
MGSLYLQKKTLTSPSRMRGSDCTMRLMFRNATYVISSKSEFSNVTNGGASFFRKFATASSSRPTNVFAYFRITFTADMTTAELACCKRGLTRSMIEVASLASRGEYFARASKIDTWPHSVHSFRAANNFCSADGDNSSTASSPDVSAISFSAATAFATTVGFGSATMSRNVSTKPRSTTSSGCMSYSFATHIAAVFRTYGSSSFKAPISGSHRYSVILSTRMQPIVRIAKALTSGFGSTASFTKVLTLNKTRSACVLA